MQLKKSSLKIISRKSPLAMWQAEHVKQMLADQLKLYGLNTPIEIIGITTHADKFLNEPLYKIGGKGLFVKELQAALIEEKADLAVHSLKDMPYKLPDELQISCILKRACPTDALVSPTGKSFWQLEKGSIIGTSSLRRQVQLKALRNDLIYQPLRGNVQTRFNKCTSGEYAAIILASAGLERLNLGKHITHKFAVTEIMPAVGQGALAIETRKSDIQLNNLLAKLQDPITSICTKAERAMNAKLGGNCSVPVAGFAKVTNEYPDVIYLSGSVGCPSTNKIIEYHASSSTDSYYELGQTVAQGLLKQGAAKIIQECINNGPSLK